jgi:hypothetical protein
MRGNRATQSASGEALARERRWYGWPARTVGEVMGVSRSRITAIEALARVRRTTAARYLAALRALSNIPPDEERASFLDERREGARRNGTRVRKRGTAGHLRAPAVSEVRRATGKPCP